MWNIRLETSDGHFVGNTHIPPFNVLPDVLIWGQRTFKLISYEQANGVALYRECFTFWVVEPVINT